MYQSTRNFLISWNKTKDDRTKLQQAYLIVVAISVVTGGLVGLLNVQYGQMFLRFAAGLLGLFVLNAFAWAVLHTFVLQKLPKNISRRK
jgi:hypothetical protein